DYQLTANNVITPNGDGKNDTWVIKNIDYYPSNTVKVFDKAGRIVYQKQGYTNDWNGTYNNTALTQGTYYYVIDFGAGLGTFKGYITIIRD
ncbi:MAG: gliding motility-associated C-terminal domain-containing protein, partial [Sphingobacteriaceae bacterium]